MWCSQTALRLSIPKILLLLLATNTRVQLSIGQTYCSSSGAVRLVGGSSSNRGRVEICLNSRWGTVCDDLWGTSDARVVCRQLGYSTSGARAYSNAYFGRGTGPIQLDNVQCSGTEQRLLSCSHLRSHNCGHHEDAGVYCSSTLACTHGSVRLVGGSSPTRGRVEVCRNSQWGTVCDDYWGTSDARVVCRQLGYSTSGARSYSRAFFGRGTGSILMDNVNCRGSERRLIDCSHSRYHNCNHYEDAGVACRVVCSSGALRLVGGTSPAQGRVEICRNSQWGTVCDDYWGTPDAQVVCRQLGYSSTNARAYSRAHFGRGTGPIQMDNVHCTGTEQRLLSCSHSTITSGCGHHEDAGVACAVCSLGAIRLVGGSSLTQGRVEVCRNSLWGTVCDDYWGTPDARVVCRQLGYSTSGARAYSLAYFGQGTGTIHLDNVHCTGTELTLLSCSHSTSTTDCGHHEDAGVACNAACSSGAVRLVGGSSLVQGRVEVCLNHRWGTVCDDFWGISDAQVVCRQLGYSSIGARAYSLAHFGQGTGPIHLDNVSCIGTEQRLLSCSHSTLTSGCGHHEDAGVACIELCPTQGSIRLVGGTNTFEGRVEVCTEGWWSAVCDDFWGSLDAQVVCRQLGYRIDGALAFSTAHFGQGIGPILLDNVHCNGSESSLLDCNYLNQSNCAHSADAGVRCQASSRTCLEGDLRLVGGQNQLEGRVEICLNSVWGTVCDDSWSTADARVVCRQLGYGTADAQAFSRAHFGQGTGPIQIDNVGCGGSESILIQCPHLTIDNCGHTEDAGVRCNLPDNCTEGELRLVGGQTPNEGRVEICLEGQWGTVCDDYWGAADAQVACKQLGYRSTGAQAFTNAHYGQGAGPIQLDKVQCRGSENSLLQCSHLATAICGHHEDAGIRCPESCSLDGAVRLIGGQKNSEGRVEYCSGGVWGTVCDRYWDAVDANIVCNHLGYPSQGAKLVNNAHYGEGSGPIHTITCTSSAQNISQCSISTFFFCTHSNDAGVICADQCLDEGDLRLIGGQNSHQGTVQVCSDEVWGTVCDDQWNVLDAAVVCSQLGYPFDANINQSAAIQLTHYGREFYIGFMKNSIASVDYLQLIVRAESSSPVHFNVETTSGMIYTGTTTASSPVTVNLTTSLQTFNSTYFNRDKGIHVYSTGEGSISVLAINYEPTSVGEYLAYPCQEIGGSATYEYFIVSTNTLATVASSEFLLVGCDDNTSITITPTQSVSLPLDMQSSTSVLTSISRGTNHNVIMNRMQTLLVEKNGTDLSGTKIVSNKPLTVVSGHECGNVPSTQTSCEHLTEQVPPTSTWGQKFLLVPFGGTNAGQYFKVITSKENTTVSRTCNSVTIVQMLSSIGSWFTFYTTSTEYCSVDTNKPVIVFQLGIGGGSSGIGDPVISMIPSLEQYANGYTFSSLSNFNINQIIVSVLPEYYQPSSIRLDGQPMVTSEWRTIYNSRRSIVGYGCHVSVAGGMTHTVSHDNPDGKLAVLVHGWSSSVNTGYAYLAGVKLFDAHTEIALTNSYYGSSSGPVQFGSVECLGNESSLFECQYDTSIECPSNRNAGVRCPEAPVIYQSPQNATVLESDPVIFLCSATGLPSPSIEWFYLEEDETLDSLSEDSDYNISTTALGDGNVTSQLYIDDATSSDAGTYVCQASSNGAKSTAFAMLDIIDSPRVNPVSICVNLHTSATFNCTSTTYDHLTITWFLTTGSSQKMLNSTSSKIIITQTLSDDQLTSTSTLTLVSVDHADAGQYVCKITSQQTSTTAVMTLSVCSAPIIYQPPQSQVTEQLLNNATFTCSANGLPIPTMSWLRVVNGQSFILTHSTKHSILITSNIVQNQQTTTLTVFNTSTTDAGSYICNAENKAGSSNVSSVLTILANVSIESLMVIYVTNETNPVTFQCTATGIPTPSITWYRNGAILLPSKDSRITNFSKQLMLFSGLYQVTQSLAINTTTDHDSANYSCVANNTVSSDTATFELIVQVKPIITKSPTNLTVQVLNNQTFSCSAVGLPRPKIHWIGQTSNNSIPIVFYTTNQYSITHTNYGDQGSSSSLNIFNASPTEVADYVCVATNVIGEATAHAHLTVYDVPIAVPSKTSIIAEEMTDVVLQCVVTGIPSPSTSWYQNGAVLSSSSHQHITVGVPIEQLLTTQIYRVTRNLTIENVTKNDSGLYTCVGENAYGNDSNVFQLTVQYHSELDLTVSASEVSVHSSVTFTCTVFGNPLPAVTWFANTTNYHQQLSSMISGVQITNTSDKAETLSSKLTLVSVNQFDAGKYTCLATNQIRSTSDSLTLSIRYVPNVIAKPTNKTVNENSNVTFTCSFTGYPGPVISWLRVVGGSLIPIESSTKHSIALTVVPSHCICQKLASSLTIMNATPDDATEYTCIATNSEGSTNISSFLSVQVAPDIVTSNKTFIINEMSPITFQCIVTGIPAPSITWYKNEEILSPNSGSRITLDLPSQQLLSSGLNKVTQTLTISSTRDEDSGDYSCVCTNVVAKDTAKFELTVRTAPLFLLVPMDQITIKPNNAVFICTATGLPRPLIQWRVETSNTQILLSNSTQLLIQESITGERERISTLRLLQTNANNTGNYTCIAENIVASINSTATLTVYVTPTIRPLNMDQKLMITTELLSSVTLSFQIAEAIPPVQNSQIQWIFSRTLSLTSSNASNVDITNLTTLNSESQYSFTSDLLSLTISNIVAADKGRYFLTATTIAGFAYSYIDIIVDGAPTIVIKPQNQTIIKGNTASFICEALAHPSHDIVWTFNNSRHLLSTNETVNTAKYSINRNQSNPQRFGSLTVYNVQYSDHGVYQCTAVNSEGSESASSTLTVHVPPSVLASSMTVSTVVNTSATLFCVVNGFPVPTVFWLKDNSPLTNYRVKITTQLAANGAGSALIEQLNISFTGDTGIGVISLLDFDFIQRRDNGQYVCQAANNFSETGIFNATSTPISLIVLEVPSAPENSSISFTAVSAYLQWHAPTFTGNNEIHGYNVYQRALDGLDSKFVQISRLSGQYSTTSTMLNITTNIRPYTKYEFAVEACNIVGCSDRLLYSPIRTNPAAPGSTPQSCLANAVSSTMINVTWNAPAIPNGLIHHYAVTYQPVQTISGKNLSSLSSFTILTSDNSTQLVLTQLLKGSFYSITMLAYTVAGPGPSSTDQCITHTSEDIPDGPPLRVNAVAKFELSITVLWSPPKLALQNGRIIHYKLLYTTNSSQTENLRPSIFLDAATFSYQLTNLSVNTRYYIMIAAGTSIGFGPYANTSIVTLNKAPPPPSEVMLESVQGQSNTITVSWKKVPSASEYMVHFQPEKSYQVDDPRYNSSEQAKRTTMTQITLVDLYPASTYKIYVKSVNAAGVGPSTLAVSMSIPPAAPESVPTMNTSNTHGVILTLRKPSNINGELSHYQVVVVYLPTGQLPSQPPDVAFPEYNLLAYDEVHHVKSRAVAYITSEFAEADFPVSGQFVVGGDNQPNDLPNKYTNGPLTDREHYTFFLRAFPKLKTAQRRQTGSNRQYNVSSSSDYTVPIAVNSGNAASTASLNQTVIISVVVVLMLILIFIAIVIVVIVVIKRITYARKFDDSDNTPIISNPVYNEDVSTYDESDTNLKDKSGWN